MKTEPAQRQLRMNALKEEITPLSNQFTEQVQVLLAKYEMPESDRKKTMEKIKEALKSITGEE